jgi:hypothetical protein
MSVLKIREVRDRNRMKLGIDYVLVFCICINLIEIKLVYLHILYE